MNDQQETTTQLCLTPRFSSILNYTIYFMFVYCFCLHTKCVCVSKFLLNESENLIINSLTLFSLFIKIAILNLHSQSVYAKATTESFN